MLYVFVGIGEWQNALLHLLVLVFSVLGILTGSEDYYNYSRCSDNLKTGDHFCGFDLRDDLKPLHKTDREYATHMYTRWAIDLVNKHDSKKVNGCLRKTEKKRNPEIGRYASR